MIKYKRVTLKKDKERSVLNFHPWIFSGAIAHRDSDIEDGNLVEVFSHDQKYLATGHFNNGSIMVRLISFERIEINMDFWREKLKAALNLRDKLGLVNSTDTNAFRLVHGEGDGLPGLIIDIYDKAAVIQCHSLGMYYSRNAIASGLKEVFENKLTTIYDKSADTIHKQNQLKVESEFICGNESSAIIKENNLLFEVNWVDGQKTGYFIDQRENRKLLTQYAKGKKVLNTFAYSGGFSIYAMKSGAERVDSIDSSRKAEAIYQRNVELNAFNNAHRNTINPLNTIQLSNTSVTESDKKNEEHFYVSDAFDFLKQSSEAYDVIILDPPAFAKHSDAVKKASIAYRNLNFEAMKRLRPSGILFTFSCSQAIDKTLFRKIVFASAALSKRHIRILNQLTQPADHPISIYHPEGEYLKGLVLYVE